MGLPECPCVLDVRDGPLVGDGLQGLGSAGQAGRRADGNHDGRGVIRIRPEDADPDRRIAATVEGMADVITDPTAVQAGPEQFPGGRIQPGEVEIQAAHSLAPDLHGSEVAIVDKRREPELPGRSAVAVDLDPRNRRSVHDPHRSGTPQGGPPGVRVLRCWAGTWTRVAVSFWRPFCHTDWVGLATSAASAPPAGAVIGSPARARCR